MSPTSLPRDILLRDGLIVVGLGVLVGLPGALALARVAQGFLPGVAPWDPLAFGGASILLVSVTALAADLPARRVAATDPVEALRGD